MDNGRRDVVVLGGGLAGLAAGFILTTTDQRVTVVERDPIVGGLSKTIVHGEFRFDLGGHRFFTKNKKIEQFVRDLMGDEFIVVPRRSKIYLRRRYFDYPLKPGNAILGMGIPTTLKIVSDYGLQKLKGASQKRVVISLEDWVIKNFGRTLFDIYFREYSEKVWGIECSRICMEWVAQRINGLSLVTAIKNAFLKFSGRDIATLADRFFYPKLGIGRISERLKDGIERRNPVFMNTEVIRLNHDNSRIKSVVARNCEGTVTIKADEFISSIPLTRLIQILHPPLPDDILKSASKLKYRDLVIVAVIINRERVTDQSWIYIPEKKIPFGRLHEPKNWSPMMAPDDKTVLVTEYFCFEGDMIWMAGDEDLLSTTISHLESLGFIQRDEVIDGIVIRVAGAYPLFEIGYKEEHDKICGYLNRFDNLHIVGRGGRFRYYNIDHAIESGIEVAEKVLNYRRPSRIDLL